MLHANQAVWLKFIHENVIPEDVDPDIVEAWKRCRDYGVDPMGGLGKKVDVAAYERALRDNQELLSIARPMMANLHEIVVSSHFSMVLADRYGRILESYGDQVIKEEVAKMRYNVGALWSEQEVGSNAIGTTLVIDKPIQFVGEDHYCLSHQNWCCSATTIHDGDGNVIGCLNMSGNRDMANSHTLGIVVAAAYTIEREMALKRSHKLVEITFESTSDGMIIVDRDLRVIKANHHAMSILSMTLEEMMELDVRSIFADLNFTIDLQDLSYRNHLFMTDCVANVGGRRINCAVNLVPIMIDNGMSGFHLAFKRAKDLHKTVNKVAGNMASYRFEDIIGESRAIRQAVAAAKKIAKTRSNVLIEGESGTGKELFAQSIHNYSSRSNGPFVAINCASLPRELIESELFGYEKGAFTGALKDGKIGKFELAEGGTIFLDEIGEMPIEVQAKLLRVLDNFTIRRIGSNYEKKLDVRVIAATNRDLLAEAEARNFRRDLYYRLNVFKIVLPPLRVRGNDLIICAQYFLKKLNEQNKYGVKVFDDDFLTRLDQFAWTGNVRELQNIIERAYYLCESSLITHEYLPDYLVGKSDQEQMPEKMETMSDGLMDLESVEKRNILAMLESCERNVLKAAKALSMSKSTIYRKMKKYGIDPKKI